MQVIKTKSLVILGLLFIAEGLAAPADSTHSLVVRSADSSGDKKSDEGDLSDATTPQIYQMDVKANISNRFAHTTVTSKVKNLADKAQEATFAVVLPESAFISGFIMEVDGKNYTAYVQEKEEAKKTYDEAVASGQGAAHVAVSARDSNRFTVSVNIEPAAKAAFYLSYEELLKRQDGHYELVINLHPGQPVKHMSVQVAIAESRKLVNLKTPPLRSGNEIGNENDELDPRADIEVVNETSAVVTFSPNVERQKQLAHILGTKENEGLAGQFVVQYDVERDPQGGEVLVQDGYFVHFFAPSELAPLPKHVVFVLDTSSSMYGQRIAQLKEAMLKILDQLHDNDVFHIVEFNSFVKVWDLDNSGASVLYYTKSGYNREDPAMKEDIAKLAFPKASAANPGNVQKAKDTISKLLDTGATDIHTALTIGLYLVQLTKGLKADVNHQPIIVFLTDGQATEGITDTQRIISDITEYNSGIRKAPLFTLSFGDGADKDFLQKIALRNSGFSRHIYEAADASLQLQDFYHQISSPLLANVSFKYAPSTTSLTTTEFPIHFGGSEIVVTGCWEPETEPVVEGWNGYKYVSFKPAVQHSITSVERLWAYLTVKQLLEKKEVSDDNAKELKQKALDLALKYSFVTPVSSLVVVKPNATNAVDTEAADKLPVPPTQYYLGGAGRLAYSGVPGPSYGHMPLRPQSFGQPSYSAMIPPGSPPVGLRSYSAVPLSSHGKYPIDLRITGDSGAGLDFNGVYEEDIVESKIASSTTRKPDLLTDVLPWLQGILNENGILNLSNGNYKLGLNETISDNVACLKTPTNSPGHCTLLHDCPQVHSLLTSVNVFVDHFCLLRNEYAGICCPEAP